VCASTGLLQARRRSALAEELETSPTWLDVLYKERRAKARAAAATAPTRFLDAPEPWPEPVDGAILVTDLAAMIRRHVVLPAHAPIAIALWVIHAHALECFSISPILAVTSPEKRCGKTTLLGLMRHLVPRALTAANMTMAAVYRAIEHLRVSLILDEADTFITTDKAELVGILNSGHARQSAYVVRTVGDSHEAKVFSTWCAKVAGLIGRLPPTLQDRSIVLQLERKRADQVVDRRRADRNDDLVELYRKTARWAADQSLCHR
jgi:putative DNA primase/helicase